MPATVDKLLGKAVLHSHTGTDLGVTVVNVITTTYTAANGTTMLINTTTAGGNVTVSLPAAATKDNWVYRIKKIDSAAYTVIVTPNGSETIDGETSKTIAFQNTAMDIVSDGSNWYII